MPRSPSFLALCVLLSQPCQLSGQGARTQSVRDFAAIAAADFQSLPSRIADLIRAGSATVTSDCGQFGGACQAVRLRADTGYDARFLSSWLYVPLLPNEIKVRGTPYYAWVPVEELKGGPAALERWRTMASKHASLGCQGDDCDILVLQEPDEGRSATTISICRADRGSDSPRRCAAIAVVSENGTWLRSVIGWGSTAVAASLQPSPIVEGFESEQTLSILQLPNSKRAPVIQAIATALMAQPLALATEFRPPVNPNAVKGRRATELSNVIERFREWASVRADLEPPVAAGDTTISTIELTATLWLSINASPQPTRPANAAESAKYLARLIENVTREVAKVCGAPFVGDRIVCR